MRRPLTCREFVRFLADYLHGELGTGERAEFDRHLAHCPSCIAYMESYRTTRTLAKVAMTEPAAAVPTDVPDELVQAVLAASRLRRGRS